MMPLLLFQPFVVVLLLVVVQTSWASGGGGSSRGHQRHVDDYQRHHRRLHGERIGQSGGIGTFSAGRGGRGGVGNQIQEFQAMRTRVAVNPPTPAPPPPDPPFLLSQLIVGEKYGGLFGYAIALDGDTLAVGEPEFRAGEENVCNYESYPTGQVYIYRRQNGSWQKEHTVKASVTNPNVPGCDKPMSLLNFGTGLDLQGDLMVVKGRLTNATSGWGLTAFIFERNAASGNWVEVDTIQEEEIAEIRIIDNDTMVARSGTALKFFSRQVLGWTLSRTLAGRRTILSFDVRNYWTVLGYSTFNSVFILNKGEAAIYQPSLDATTGFPTEWKETTTLVPRDTEDVWESEIGAAVCWITNDEVAVGVVGTSAFYFFERQGDSSWVEIQTLALADGTVAWGSSCLVHQTANKDYFIGGSSPESAYVFSRPRSGGAWMLDTVLTARGFEREPLQEKMAMSSDGREVVLGGPNYHDEAGVVLLAQDVPSSSTVHYAGAVYIMSRG